MLRLTNQQNERAKYKTQHYADVKPNSTKQKHKNNEHQEISQSSDFQPLTVLRKSKHLRMSQAK